MVRDLRSFFFLFAVSRMNREIMVVEGVTRRLVGGWLYGSWTIYCCVSFLCLLSRCRRLLFVLGTLSWYSLVFIDGRESIVESGDTRPYLWFLLETWGGDAGVLYCGRSVVCMWQPYLPST